MHSEPLYIFMAYKRFLNVVSNLEEKRFPWHYLSSCYQQLNPFISTNPKNVCYSKSCCWQCLGNLFVDFNFTDLSAGPFYAACIHRVSTSVHLAQSSLCPFACQNALKLKAASCWYLALYALCAASFWLLNTLIYFQQVFLTFLLLLPKWFFHSCLAFSWR